MATTPRNGSTAATTTGTGAFTSNLSEAGVSLKQAAVDTGEALRNAAVAAGEELRVGKANLKADLADSALASLAAAEVAGSAAKEPTRAGAADQCSPPMPTRRSRSWASWLSRAASVLPT